MMNRNLDGVYFRVERNGKWCNVCFSDLCEAEMTLVLDRWWHGDKDEYIKALRRMCIMLGKRIREIGDTYNIDLSGEEDDE